MFKIQISAMTAVVGIFYNEEDAEECVKDRPFSNCSIFLLSIWRSIIIHDRPMEASLLVELAVAGIMGQQSHNGVHINRVKTGFYIHVLSEKINALDRIAVPQLPKELEKGCVATEPFLKTGGHKANVANWLKKEGIELEIEGPFCGISWKPFSMGRTEAIKEYLAGIGWKPDTWKFKDITMHSSIKRPLNPKEQRAALDNYMHGLRNTHMGALRLQLLGIKRGTMTPRQVREFLLKKKKVPTGAKLTEESLKDFEGVRLGLS